MPGGYFYEPWSKLLYREYIWHPHEKATKLYARMFGLAYMTHLSEAKPDRYSFVSRIPRWSNEVHGTCTANHVPAPGKTLRHWSPIPVIQVCRGICLCYDPEHRLMRAETFAWNQTKFSEATVSATVFEMKQLEESQFGRITALRLQETTE